MRHRSKRHNFHRRPGPRVALIRGMVYSLVEHGRIKTTLARAKEIRRHVEKAITLGRKGTLNSRRLLLSRYPNENVVELLVTDLKKRFETRPGGYTRIVKLGARTGDQADMAFLEFVDYVPKAAATEETVKGDKEAPKRAAKNAKSKLKLRKNVRKIAATSRRELRASL
ncbi:MAG: 50S ribosomal protein L17 [Bdellovibrionales bacterium]|nr:50S ribosomal protein L17 [Bdellovibrionales bacterium]